jgi:DNA-binding NtrC family response regulator
MSKLKTIFVVDDDPMMCEMLKDHLSKMSDFTIHVFETGEACIENLHLNPDVIFLDYYLDRVKRDAMTGLVALHEIKEKRPETDVVFLSGQDKIEVAVAAMKEGAFDYIVKGESAMYRAEKTVFNIYRYHRLKGSAAQYKRLTIVFAICFVLMIMLVIWLKQAGHISNMPGWS